MNLAERGFSIPTTLEVMLSSRRTYKIDSLGSGPLSVSTERLAGIDYVTREPFLMLLGTIEYEAGQAAFQGLPIRKIHLQTSPIPAQWVDERMVHFLFGQPRPLLRLAGIFNSKLRALSNLMLPIEVKLHQSKEGPGGIVFPEIRRGIITVGQGEVILGMHDEGHTVLTGWSAQRMLRDPRVPSWVKDSALWLISALS